MKKKTTQVLAFVLCAVFVFGLTGCSNPASSAPSTPADSVTSAPASSGEKVHLLFAASGFSQLINIPGHESRTPNVGDYATAIAEDYVAENPNVDIDVLVISAASGTTETLDVEIASGNVPNLFFSQEKLQSKYKGMGLIEPLNPYFTAEEVGDYLTGMFSPTTEWRIPMYSTPKLICINKTLFEKAGAVDLLPSPDDRNWTTDQYVKALKAINDPGKGIYATMLFAKTPSAQESMMGYYWPYGARMFNKDDLSHTTLNSPESVKALAFMKGLLDAGLTVPAPTALTDDDMWAMFEKQTLAVIPEVPLFEAMAQSAGFEVYYVNYPHPEGSNPGPLWVSMTAVTVWKNENQAAVKESTRLGKFIADKWSMPLSVRDAALPVRKSKQSEVKLSEELQAVVNLLSQVGTVSNGTALPIYQTLRETFKTMEAYVFTGQKTPQDALAWFEAELNAAIKEGS